MAERKASIPLSQQSAEIVKLKLDQINSGPGVKIIKLAMGTVDDNGQSLPALVITMEV